MDDRTGQQLPGEAVSRFARPDSFPGEAGLDSSRPRDVFILGFRFTPCTGREVVGIIASAVKNCERLVVGNANLHGLAAMYRSRPMASLLTQSDAMVLVDSMPILFLAALGGKVMPRAKRTTSLDFYDLLFRVGIEHGWKFGFLGGTPDVEIRGLDVLRRRFPGLNIDGRPGYFDMEDRRPGSAYREVLDWVTTSSHDILIVGMGMPRQEEWIHAVQAQVPTRVFLPSGAYLDYQAGAQKPAPRWLGQIGFEWAYRLSLAPRRLSFRYLIEPLVLIYRLMAKDHPQAEYRRRHRQEGRERES